MLLRMAMRFLFLEAAIQVAWVGGERGGGAWIWDYYWRNTYFIGRSTSKIYWWCVCAGFIKQCTVTNCGMVCYHGGIRV